MPEDGAASKAARVPAPLSSSGYLPASPHRNRTYQATSLKAAGAGPSARIATTPANGATSVS
jgi:hypothetical protein